jgi:hypothetical protein
LCKRAAVFAFDRLDGAGHSCLDSEVRWTGGTRREESEIEFEYGAAGTIALAVCACIFLAMDKHFSGG